jgi:recombination associated protein RdgC
MPFRSGGLSVRRYLVLEEIPKTLPQTATLAIRRYGWRPIDDSRGEKESFGWVNPRNILAEQFTYDQIVDGGYMLLGTRRDKKAFSQVLFRARRQELFEETKKERKLQKLSRQQRIALEEQLTIEMLKETSAQSAFSELVWDMNSNIVYMGATSNPLCERMQELFEATFDIKLRPLYPAIIGARYIAQQGLEEEFHLASAAVGAGAQGGDK